MRDHAPLELDRREPLRLRASVDRLGRRQIDVEPDKVHQLERSHPKAGGTRQRVELFDRRDAAFERAQRLEIVRARDAIDDESRRIRRQHGVLPHLRRNLESARERVVARLRRRHDLKQLHTSRWVEEMQADHALGMRHDVGKLADRERRSIRCEQRFGRERICERNENLAA